MNHAAPRPSLPILLRSALFMLLLVLFFVWWTMRGK